MDPDITQLLHDWRGGDSASLDRLMPLLYDTLRDMAARRMLGERADSTLQPTALVNEAVLRMLGSAPQASDRVHFLALAALNMRSVLVDHARARLAQRRGGGALAVTLSRAEADANAEVEAIDVDLLALDQALTTLAAHDARTARSVELFYFGGLEREEIAQELGVSVPTIDRDLRFARAWLKRELA